MSFVHLETKFYLFLILNQTTNFQYILIHFYKYKLQIHVFYHYKNYHQICLHFHIKYFLYHENDHLKKILNIKNVVKIHIFLVHEIFNFENYPNKIT
jgi:hypothetical protein